MSATTTTTTTAGASASASAITPASAVSTSASAAGGLRGQVVITSSSFDLIGQPINTVTPASPASPPPTHSTVIDPSATPETTNAPNPTGSAEAKAVHKGPRPDVYYLVLLGILVVLIVFAAILTLRGHRMRRRYRTATQLAIARGEPVSWWREGEDEPAPLFRPVPPGPPEHWANVGPRKQRRWMRIPIMWDAVDDGGDALEKELLIADADSDSDPDSGWSHIQPLTAHSLIPELPGPQPSPGPPPAPPTTVLGLLRYGFTYVPQYPAAPAARESELERAADLHLEDDEPLRVAVIVQMPVSPEDEERDRARREMMADEDEDGGWREGMEIGVWEGSVAAPLQYPPPPHLPPSRAGTPRRQS